MPKKTTRKQSAAKTAKAKKSGRTKRIAKR
jgi:hypothetical protein